MTPKQEKFCHEYLVDLNGAQAAIRAGYSENGAAVVASRLLSKANVASCIKELRDVATEKAGLSVQYVLDGLTEIAERCMQKRPVMKWDYQRKEMIQVTDEEGRDVWQFDSMGANRAMELLGKHVGAFEMDNNQKRPLIQINVVD
jgi:phage terminase small subunit